MSLAPEVRSSSVEHELARSVAGSGLEPALQASSSSPSRPQVCMIAVALAAFIAVEPWLLDGVSPGLQLFQSVLLVWFWGLFMFRGPASTAGHGH